MKIAGIICECNPLHGGHLYLMEQARRGGADGVVCVMSGCFTQRGEAAVIDPRIRAKMLLESGGADAVFELPYPYSASGADYFAAAGVSVLDRLGVDEIWFGSECGDLDALRRGAEIARSREFCEEYRSLCRNRSEGTAEGYLQLMRRLGGPAELLSNDILGISYLKALIERDSRMRPVTVKRVGAAYRETQLEQGAHPSASALRSALAREGVDAWRPYLSESLLRLARKPMEQGIAPADLKWAERAILSYFRLVSPETLEQAPELQGGLGRRVAEAARRARSLEELLEASVTKKYTASRVRRGVLFAMTGVSEEDLRREPAYAVLLAANSEGCRFLAERKKLRTIPVVTCHGDLPDSADARRQAVLTEAAFSLYGLTLPSPQPADFFLRCSSEIVK